MNLCSFPSRGVRNQFNYLGLAVPLDEIISKGVRDSLDVAAFASRNDKQVAIMVWHYHDDDFAGPDASIELKISGVAGTVKSARVSHYRVDQFHSNSYDAWRRTGSPSQRSKSRCTTELIIRSADEYNYPRFTPRDTQRFTDEDDDHSAWPLRSDRKT